MNIVSRIQFPQTDVASELYFKVDKSSTDFSASVGAASLWHRQVPLHQGSTISFNTYFNSFYESFYTKYTILSSLYYLLKLEGDFEVAVYRDEGSKKELLFSHKFEQCQLSDYVKVSLPELRQDQEAGRIYLEITCLSEQGLFSEGLLVTEQEKQRDVSFGIITCTFKKEFYVKKTVNAILQDSLLQDKQFKVFVVDNGKTLNGGDFESEKVKLISNRNVGGAGGFTKGLIEALQEGIYSHFLFMDDDIELDSEVIYKLFSLYEYAKQDFAISGSMLDLYKKHILYEAGAVYNKCFDNTGNLQYYPFEITSLKRNLDLRDPLVLNLLLSEDNIDYGSFWFFAFSKEVIESIGLPFPFFMKIDDIEFGLRVKQYLDNRIVAFPSFAVWHEPFYAKKPVWDVYYCTRNQLITNSIHDSLTYLRTIKILTKCIIYNLLRFDYNSAQMYVKGFNDYMEGANFIRSHDSEILHSKIFADSKSYKSQSIVTNLELNGEDYQVTKTGRLKKIFTLLTLNGHLLPRFLISDESAVIRQGFTEQDSVCKAFAKKRIIFVMEKNPQSYQNELDNKAGINILLSWIKSALKSRLKWSAINAEWKKATQELTSIKFWQDYLEPH